VVSQFETCAQRVLPLERKFIFLPVVYVNFSFCAFHYFAVFELSTRSVHCTPDENDRPSEQTNRFSRFHSMWYII